MGPLYQIIHKVHHNSVNPGPWSGLSMHTFEHILSQFSSVLIFFVVPSNPLHAMFLMRSALGPAVSHYDFDRIVIGDERCVSAGDFFQLPAPYVF